METPAMFLNQKTPNCKAAAAVNEDKMAGWYHRLDGHEFE